VLVLLAQSALEVGRPTGPLGGPGPFLGRRLVLGRRGLEPRFQQLPERVVGARIPGLLTVSHGD
jgi:hypothetical protein